MCVNLNILAYKFWDIFLTLPFRDVSHPHLIGIQPVYDKEGCANQVIASSLSKREDNSLIWITAKDKSKYRKYLIDFSNWRCTQM